MSGCPRTSRNLSLIHISEPTRQAESYGGGVGSAYDLFMVVPRAALGLTGMPSPVPEIDPAGIGSTLALLGGCLGLLERRRKRT